MDKRTIIFVISLTLTLFLVNLFFENQGSEERRIRQEQQLAKNEEKLKKLQQDAKQRTVSIEALPLVTLYSDAQGEHKAVSAVKSDDAYLTIEPKEKLPEILYVHSAPLKLANAEAKEGNPAIYRAGKQDLLLVSPLPLIGKFEIQVVTMPQSGTPQVMLGEYADGHFTLTADKIADLEQQIRKQNGEIKKITSPPETGEGIALLKLNAKQYVPVGIYNFEQKSFTPLESMVKLDPFLARPEKTFSKEMGEKPSETYYVLETPYQQLVFSNYGGALVEINLPFKSEENPKSVVKEIDFDRDMIENHPYDARFPLHPYFTPGEGMSGEFVKHAEGVLGGYYPLLRRDLIQKDHRNDIIIKPRYYATNIVSEYPETAELIYTVKHFDKETIVFEAVQTHRRITKTYSVAAESQAPYCIDLTIAIEGDSRGLWLTSGIPEVEWISGGPAPALKYRITRSQQPVVEAIELPKETTTVTSAVVDWVCNSNGFLGMIMDPLGNTEPGYRAQKVPGQLVPSRLVEIDEEYHRFNADEMPGYMLLLPLKAAGGSMHFRFFSGPFATSILETVDKIYSNPATGYNPDYIACQTFHGWFAFISEPFAKFLFILMNFFHFITRSWGFSIILLTVALRIILYPLTAWSTKSMIRMQQIAPEITAIQQKYKKDPKKAQLEIVNLYRERGVNPVSGCFPLLIQMPFLIGMFDLLKSTFELRGACFIPGWIDDLSAPDVVFSWNYPIPFIGTQFHLLPILLGIVMYVQQRFMSTTPKDPAQMTDQQRQQRFMGNIMAIVFTVLFYSFPSGLNIYWLSSMLLGIAQQSWTNRHMKKVVEPSAKILPKKKKAKRDESLASIS